MQEAVIRGKIVELNEYLTCSHPERGDSSRTEGLYVSDRSPTEATLDDTLEVLALHLKYLVFDLESTRRENRYLRQLLESQRSRRQDDDREG